MADTKISDMTAAVSVADADLVPVVQGGANKRATAALVRAGLVSESTVRTANTILAGPTTGAAAAATFRALVAADIPSLSYQPVDATLTALAALGAGPGFLQVTGQDTFSIAGLSGAQVNTALGYTAANAASLASSALTGALPALDGSALTALVATNIASGTLDAARLPTVPTTLGGTGLTAIGTALQVLRVNAGATALEFADPAGGISGLTAGALPYATSGTALADSPLVRVDANTVALRNGTNAQKFQLYESYTDASNYSRLVVGSPASYLFDIYAEQAGTGGVKEIRFNGFGLFSVTVTSILLGNVYPLDIKSGFPPNCYVRPAAADVMDLGGPSNQFVDFYNGKSYQGGRLKDITDGADIAFVRVANATADTLVAGHINYTIASLDSSGHLVEGQSGTVYFAIRNQNGTVTATPDGTGNVADVLKNIGSIGTVTFKTSIATTNCDFAVNADTTLTATAFKIVYTVVITSGTAVITSL